MAGTAKDLANQKIQKLVLRGTTRCRTLCSCGGEPGSRVVDFRLACGRGIHCESNRFSGTDMVVPRHRRLTSRLDETPVPLQECCGRVGGWRVWGRRARLREQVVCWLGGVPRCGRLPRTMGPSRRRLRRLGGVLRRQRLGWFGPVCRAGPPSAVGEKDSSHAEPPVSAGRGAAELSGWRRAQRWH